ncbi:uncharacterized protein LOC132926658 isoform X1 [Rhopalosiphum padi]|uniref:uncharacterized protein LOC132926658 isoform X1 n=1 Tax=Rhopalosiphum padi TaxID=40932 RepID=UPI00298E5D8E|nr:uncharacterized protein LOC132926658 isoform X1 [Rhopalosiphum padi]XP_060847015.1 uncharacterized protein LOC132926658 isoform X1 [Rhopalosiphum padi]
MDRIVNENYNDCLTSQVNTEKMIPSVSSVKPTTIVENTGDNIIVEQRQNLANLSTPNSFDRNRLKSSTPLVVPLFTIGDSDSDEEDNVNEDDLNDDEVHVITIESSDDEINEEEQTNQRTLNRSIRRINYKIRRVINVILRYYKEGLCDEEILHLEEKRDSLRRTNRRINRALRTESTQPPMSEDQILRRVQTLRRRYLEAIRSAHEFSYIWSNDELNNTINSVSEYSKCINTVILKRDNDVSVTLGSDGELESNELDFVIQNMENSDTECSSESETSTSYNEFTPAYIKQRVKNKDRRNRLALRYQRRLQRLQRRQMLRNRFKKVHHELYSGNDESPTSSRTRHFEEKNKLSNNRDSVQNDIPSSTLSVLSKNNVTIEKSIIEVIQIESSDDEPDDYSSSDEFERNHQNLARLHETACQTQPENGHSLFLENRPLSEMSLSTLKNTQKDNNSNQNLPLMSTVEQVQETNIHVVETGKMTDNRYDKVEVVEPPHTNVDCVNQNVNGSHANITLREVAQTIAAATRALSTTHTEIFQGIIRMADALYKTTIEPIAEPTEEARPVKKGVFVETEIVDENPYIKVRQQYMLDDLQQMMDAIWNLISRPIPLGRVESSATALQTSIEMRVRRAEQAANNIVSRKRIAALSPSTVSTSATQIFTIESQQSTRDTHRIHLSRSELLDDNDNQSTSQSKPSTSEVRQHKQPSPPIIIITPPPNDPESSITEKLPNQHDGIQWVVETNRLSSHTNAKSLLTPPKIKVQRRSRSRTRDPLRPRRFCSPSPPGGSRVRNISQEQKRRKSKSLLAGRRSPTSPPVPTTLHLPLSQLPCSSRAANTADISASTTVAVVATETIAGRPNLSPPPPPEALRSTLQPALNDDGATASLSQTAFALLELSGQSPKSDQTINTLVVDDRTVQTTATTTTVIASAAAAADDDDDELMSNSDVLATFDVGGGGLARNPATKRQRSRSRSNSPSNARKLKPSSPSGSEQQQPNAQ